MNVRPAHQGLAAALAAPVRLQELLADRVMLGEAEMSQADRHELADLERQFPVEAEAAEIELARALAVGRSGRRYLAAASAIPAVLPSALRGSIARDADLVLGSAASTVAGTSATVAGGSGSAAATGGGAVAATGGGTAFLALSWKTLAVCGWLAASAALVSTGIMGVTAWETSEAKIDAIAIHPGMATVASISDAQATYHVAKDPDAISIDIDDADGNAGRFIWSGRLQAGLLHAERLELAGDDARYQVWLIDGDRPSGANRVDGGLFDVTPEQGIDTIPIRPKLPIGRIAGVIVTRAPANGSVYPSDATPVVLRGQR